jgi:2-polyprenyl-3-methyl-5-hydroxy-6-metoxy-1,4-benzoquinol methylase
MPLINMFRKLWVRYWLRNVKFSGRYDDIKMLYRVKDPWNLTDPAENDRFVQTNKRISELIPNCRRLLELGCGEGLQTQYLAQISEQVYGVDVSPLAIQRAEKNCPGAVFKAGTAESVAELFPDTRFDVVTACEVLYYVREIPPVIQSLQSHADSIFVTNYLPRSEVIRHNFQSDGWTKQEPIVSGDRVWECFLWRKS